MVTTRNKPLPAETSFCRGGDATESLYEKSRNERIKENNERMKSLGILQLTLKLKSECRRTKPIRAPRGDLSVLENPLSQAAPPRRSSRLQNVAPIHYSGSPAERYEKPLIDDRSVWPCEGQREEVYTEEHEKLLGSCEIAWNLFADGYDSSGKRIYDQAKGKTCHQCRQKTLGLRTSCVKCNLVQGQFCGDCLYMRSKVLDTNQ